MQKATEDLINVVRSMLDGTDPRVLLTYEEYLSNCAQGRSEPISIQQWDTLFSVLGTRGMCPSDVPEMWRINLVTALHEHDTAKAKEPIKVATPVESDQPKQGVPANFYQTLFAMESEVFKRSSVLLKNDRTPASVVLYFRRKRLAQDFITLHRGCPVTDGACWDKLYSDFIREHKE